MNYETYGLKNGIRLIHQRIKSEVAHCGLIINAGSRDEKENEHGIAHFIEHLLFKGTQKRTAFNISDRLESVGGEINAYTTKEETCIYSTFLKNYYARSLELMSDIIFNSTFPKKEMIKEKEIILDEINSYKDTPIELIYDDFEELVFKNVSIGRNILGNKKNLKKFTKQDIVNFISRNYLTDQIVISSVGNISFSKLISIADKYFGHIKSNKKERSRNGGNIKYVPEIKRVKKRTYQAHCIMGNIAYNIKDEKRIIFVLLNNILGGPGFNSRLNLIIREKYGYAYNIESVYSPYSDTGIFGIYVGADKKDLDKTIDLIYKELELLRSKKLSNTQLRKAKKQLIGQMAIYAENNENLMLSNGKSYLIFNKVDTLAEIKAKIDNIASEDLLTVANEILVKENMSMLIYY